LDHVPRESEIEELISGDHAVLASGSEGEPTLDRLDHPT
jgi:hypothetical protein